MAVGVPPGFGRPCRATHPGLWGGIAPIGAYTAVGLCAVVGAQGLEGVAPVGLLCVEGCLTQGLVALTGLRTLGFGKGSPL